MSCDIIMVVWNNKELTRQCVNSIFANTHCAYRLVIVDNASDKPTREYLESLKISFPDKVALIRNQENSGFTKAVNQGVRNSSADYVCIVNNDILVFDNWLSEMIAVAESSKDIGIVNPNNNFGRKKPWNKSYEQYATQMTEGQKCKFVETASPVGFCYLIKREVINKIGLWDERFNPGYFEDTEYALRARNAGFKSVFAKAAFVFHLEHASFKKLAFGQNFQPVSALKDALRAVVGKVLYTFPYHMKRGFNPLFKQSEEKFYQLYKRPERFLYILADAGTKYYNKIKEDSYGLAKNSNWVWIFLKKSAPSIDLYEHTYIRTFRIWGIFFKLIAIFKILFKKKKFSKILVDDKNLSAELETLKRFHRAEVQLL